MGYDLLDELIHGRYSVSDLSYLESTVTTNYYVSLMALLDTSLHQQLKDQFSQLLHLGRRITLIQW